jgi:signal transduction histidine kinase
MAADLAVPDPALSESTKVTFTMAAVVVFGLVVLAWGRLRWERRVVQSERSSLVAAERTRIARDLHDDIGTQLTALALQAELLRHDAPSEMAAPLQDLARQARTLSGRMSEVVWALNPSCDTLPSFAGYLTDYVSQWGELTDTRFTIRVPPNLPALPMRAEARHHLALVVREALANVAKHSGATHTTLRIEIAAETLRLTVQDNGRGFDLLKVAQETPSTTGNGLRNQRARVEELGGRLELSTGPGRGTCFEVTIPLAGLQTIGR